MESEVNKTIGCMVNGAGLAMGTMDKTCKQQKLTQPSME